MWRMVPVHRLVDHEEAWQTLNVRCYNAHPLLDAKFMVPLYDCFGSDDIMLMAREQYAGKVVGLALVQKAGLGSWRLFMPSQANMGPILLDDGGSAMRAREYLDELAKSLPGVTFQLGLQKQDPLYSRLTEIKHDSRLERIPDWTTTYIDTDGGFELFWQTRSKNVRQRVRRTLKRLEAERIAWRLEEHRSYGTIAQGVRDYGELESAGWKGREGTAVRRGNIQGEFYTRVLQNFARTGNAKIYQLYFNNRLAASLLTISHNPMLVVLKTSYDNSMAELSPGRLIDYLMLQRAFKDPQITRIENYTNASAEDAKWCSGTRMLYHLNLYYSRTVRRLAEIRRCTTTFVRRWTDKDLKRGVSALGLALVWLVMD